MDSPTTKVDWRARVRQARRTRDQDPGHGPAIAEHLLDLDVIREACAAGQPIACYASRSEEPSTDALRVALREAGAQVLLPRVEGDDLVWCVEDPQAELQVNAWGIPEPVAPPSDLAPAAWIIPGLAIDSDGYRLGQGGGFYDRYLADLPDDGRGPIIAVVFEHEVVPELPREDHDHPVDVVITPERVRWLAMPD